MTRMDFIFCYKNEIENDGGNVRHRSCEHILGNDCRTNFQIYKRRPGSVGEVPNSTGGVRG